MTLEGIEGFFDYKQEFRNRKSSDKGRTLVHPAEHVVYGTDSEHCPGTLLANIAQEPCPRSQLAIRLPLIVQHAAPGEHIPDVNTPDVHQVYILNLGAKSESQEHGELHSLNVNGVNLPMLNRCF